MENREIELKLRIAPEDVARLKRHPLIRSLSVGRSITQNLNSVYFDTPKLALLGRDVTLRVRRIGSKHVQTVKTGSVRQLGLFRRGEVEQSIAGEAPEIDKIADPALRALVAKSDIAAKLRPIFDTEVKRVRRRLTQGKGEIALDIDVGVIRTAKASTPICEIELELMAGEPDQLFDLVRRLSADVPMRLGTASKAARGFALYAGAPNEPARAAPVVLGPAPSAEQAMIAIVRACFDHLVANETAVVEAQHTEGVHQMRVALRRLRSALSLSRSLLPGDSAAGVKTEANWMAGELADARNWDVFQDEVLAPVLPRFPNHSGMAGLEAAAERARLAGYRRALAAIATPRYGALLLRGAAWLEERPWRKDTAAAALDQPASPFAATELTRRHRKAIKLGRSISTADAEALHRLRIQLKKLRYTCEFFRDLFPNKSTKAYIANLAKLQDVLGTLNDVEVARTLLDSLLKRVAGEPGGPERAGELQNATGLVAGWHVHTADRRARKLDDLWQVFKGTRPFWPPA
ncbi:MAG: CHAD domain-containing protein [Alphaproteobacteria bacterium]|nr:CHAD domain-containing protein [Alphaproteobacteria bacterium]